jgi:hypothetical protein
MARLLEDHMRSTVLVVLTLLVSVPGLSGADTPRPSPSPSTAPASPKPSPGARSGEAADVRCEAHGVSKKVCARCNPKLAAVFKAKGDWCAEHERPETQCVICHPDLAKKGVK